MGVLDWREAGELVGGAGCGALSGVRWQRVCGYYVRLYGLEVKKKCIREERERRTAVRSQGDLELSGIRSETIRKCC